MKSVKSKCVYVHPATGEPMLSLYDFLKRPAGGKLGKAVWEQAKQMKVSCDFKTRNVDFPKYKGKIVMYPVSFLNAYFNNNTANISA